MVTSQQSASEELPSMGLTEGIIRSLLSLLMDLLIDEPREVRLLQVITWVGIGVILWGLLNILRNFVFTTSLLLISLATTVVMYRSASRSVNYLINNTVLINNLLTNPGNITSLIEGLENKNVIDDLYEKLRSSKNVKELLRYSPIPLLPLFTAILIMLATTFAISTVMQQLTSIGSHRALMVGIGITILSTMALTVISLTVKTAGTTNQESPTNHGINYMQTYVLNIVNNYFNPTNAKSTLGRIYRAIHYLLIVLPKPKLRINTPRVYAGVYVSNDELCDKLPNFVSKYIDRRINNREEKVEHLRRILNCGDYKINDQPKNLLEVESPHELVDLSNPNFGEVFPLRHEDEWMIVLIKAWKGCTSILKRHDHTGVPDPKYSKMLIKCIRRRVITVFAIGSTELLGRLDTLLRMYSRPPDL